MSRFLLFVVFVQLVGVVGRIADDDADFPFVLAADARDVFLAHAAEQVADMLIFLRLERRRVVERVNEAEVGKFLVVLRNGRVRRLDVQVGDVIGQNRDLVGSATLPNTCSAASLAGRGSARSSP